MRSPDWQSDDGSVTLYHGDCLQILPEIEAGSVDAVVTDPPYPGLVGGAKGNRNHLQKGVALRRNDTTSVGTPWGESLDWCAEAWRVCGLGAAVMCSHHAVDSVRRAFGAAKAIALGVWYKRNAPPNFKNVPRHNTEFIWFLQKTSGLKWDSLKTTMWDIPMLQGGCMATERVRNDDGSTAHPTQKPLRLMNEILSISPDSVIDPFMGSGTTGVACVRTGRKFIGIEIDKGYFSIAVRRIEQAIREKSEELVFA